MPYKIAGIDVHKRMLHVVVSDVEVDGEYDFTRRQLHAAFSYAHRFPLSYKAFISPCGGSGEHGSRYFSQGRELSPGKRGDAQSFAQHACSGSDNISASASPLRRRPRRSGPLRILTLTHFHKNSRAEGPARQYWRRMARDTFSPADQATNIKNQERIFRLAGSIDRVISRHHALQFEKYSTHGRAPDL